VGDPAAIAPAEVSAANPTPATPAPAPAPPPPDTSRRVDDLGRPLTGSVPQGSYESRLRGAFSRTQSLQGPLDGTWMLKDMARTNLYRVQLVDPGFAGGRLEGAWSDLKAVPAVDASGFFSTVERDGPRLTLKFARTGQGPMVIALDQRPDGGFAGELSAGGRTTAVTLTRP
jgi:hypothetical protein